MSEFLKFAHVNPVASSGPIPSHRFIFLFGRRREPLIELKHILTIVLHEL